MEEIMLYALGGMILILLLFCIILFRKMSFLEKRYQKFMQGSDGASLEFFLRDLHGEIGVVRGEVKENRERMQGIIAVLDTTIRGVGLLRFNAFQDTGSDLSFAVAYLDAHQNGVVISSIYGREETRTYAKPLEKGHSSYQLSTEEQQAIAHAAASVRLVAGSGSTQGRKG